jgi:hypothetical protein
MDDSQRRWEHPWTCSPWPVAVLADRRAPVTREITELQVRESYLTFGGPPLWSSGQSSWLQIRKPGFVSRHYQKKKVVGLERGPLSLVSTTEELLDRKVAAPV